MVLREAQTSRLLCLLLASSAAILAPQAAVAQELERATPVLDLPPGEYPQTPIMLGDAALYAAADLRVEYDSNIYAAPDDVAEDLKLLLVPRLKLQLSDDALRLVGFGEMQVRRYLKYETENSTSGSVGTTLTWDATSADRLSAAAGWSRLVEERGDPEARLTPAVGPRLSDMWRAELGYSRQSQRLALQFRGSATRFEHTSRVDAERDHDVYTGSARLGYRAGGLASGFGEVFVTSRDFRLATDLSGVDRDATTYGARIGTAIDPGGKIRGEAAVGLFRVNPGDDRLEARTGFSAEAAMVYQPTRRLAFTLDAFSGDVATVRSGAQARFDTRVRLGVQQEAYHNLRWQAGLLYRRSNFIGAGIHEQRVGSFAEVEYLVNRRLAVALVSRFVGRKTDVEPEDGRPQPEREPGLLDHFERFRGGIEFRLQY